MDYKKTIEQQLNNLKDNKNSLEIIPTLLKKTKLEVYTMEKAFNKLEEEEQRIIQRVCIDNISPYDLEKEFNCSYRKIYKLKDAALKKITMMVYGTKFMKEVE